MNMFFDTSLADGYKNKAQIIRVLSEAWVSNNVFCPCCGREHIRDLKNNLPVADMQCDNCGEIFELKSKSGKIGNKIVDGAYSTMMQRINSAANPELFVMQYTPEFEVTDLTLIPKFFFVPGIIEKRKPLSQTAQRAGWVGCNILYGNIPEQGKIEIIKNGNVTDKNLVVEKYNTVKKLQTNNIDLRSWLFDVLNCVNSISNDEFTLIEVYGFEETLQNLHSNNHNIKAKIRQQLQILRDKGFIEFSGKGTYRKVI